MQRMVTAIVLTALLAGTGTAFAQKNPCNPCGGKAAKNPCNPCGAKAALLAVNPCHAKMGTVFYVSDPMQRNQVSFESTAPLEDIIGTTNDISGYVVIDPKRPDGGAKGKLIVSVASLETGIPLRDDHLRSDVWLDAVQHPHITFELTGLSGVQKKKSGDGYTTYSATVEGKLSLRGITKAAKAPATLVFMKESGATKQKLPGDLLFGRANLQVALTDYDVKGMAGVVGSKVAESIEVSISFTATTQEPRMAMNPCNPCGGKEAKNPCNPCGDKH